MKLGILMRHAFKLKTENMRIYSSFVDSFDTLKTFEYSEVMGFFARRKDFKDISHSLFVFKNKAHAFAHISCRANSLDFTQTIATPAEHAIKKYQELTKSFGFIINTESKQIDEAKKKEAFNSYQEINGFLDNLPESLRQTVKAK